MAIKHVTVQFMVQVPDNATLAEVGEKVNAWFVYAATRGNIGVWTADSHIQLDSTPLILVITPAQEQV